MPIVQNLETRVDITARDKTGNVFDKIERKFGRATAFLGNLGFATDTLKRIGSAITDVFTRAFETNSEINKLLFENEKVSFRMLQTAAQSDDAWQKLTNTFEEFREVNRSVVLALNEDDLAVTQKYENAVDGLRAEYNRLGTALYKFVAPAFSVVASGIEKSIKFITKLVDGVNDFFNIAGDRSRVQLADNVEGLNEQLVKAEERFNANIKAALGLEKQLIDLKINAKVNPLNGAKIKSELEQKLEGLLAETNVRIEQDQSLIVQVENRLKGMEELNAIFMDSNEKTNNAMKKCAADTKKTQQQVAEVLNSRPELSDSLDPRRMDFFNDEDKAMSNSLRPIDTSLEPLGPMETRLEGAAKIFSAFGDSISEVQTNFGMLQQGMQGFSSFFGQFASGIAGKSQGMFKAFKALHVAMAAVSVASAAAQALADWQTAPNVFAKFAIVGKVLAAGGQLISAIKGTNIGSPKTVSGIGGASGGNGNQTQQTPNIGAINNRNQSNRLIVNLNGRRGYSLEDVEEIIKALNDFDTGTQININRVGI